LKGNSIRQLGAISDFQDQRWRLKSAPFRLVVHPKGHPTIEISQRQIKDLANICSLKANYGRVYGVFLTRPEVGIAAQQNS
jgi:hypothetical protein